MVQMHPSCSGPHLAPAELSLHVSPGIWAKGSAQILHSFIEFRQCLNRRRMQRAMRRQPAALCRRLRAGEPSLWDTVIDATT